MPAGEVTGAREAMAALRYIDRELANELRKDIKSAAEPLRAAVAAAAPDPPLSNMARGARATTNYGGRKGPQGTTLVKVKFTGPKWTAAADLAQTGVFGRNLSAKLGGPSRWVWPTAERHLPAITGAVTTSVNRMMDRAQSMLGGKG